jgi:sigma-B regulation protein RsbU (phosphoserine phosphatase)
MSSRTFHIQVPAEAVWLRTVRAFATSVLEEAFGDCTTSLVLALDEACANVVKHRTPVPGHDDIDVRIELDAVLARFRIGCFCSKRDLPRIRPRDVDDARPGGLGTHLICRIMDRVDYVPDTSAPGRMVLVLEKRLQPEA